LTKKSGFRASDVPSTYSAHGTIRASITGPKLEYCGDEIELSPMPGDFATEHPLLIEITVFQKEPSPQSESHPTGRPDDMIDTWSVRIAKDGTPSGSGYVGSLSMGEFQGWGPGAPLSADSLAKVKSLIATLPNDPGRAPPRNHKVQVIIATSHGTEKRIYDAANLPEALLEIFRMTNTQFTPPPM
jgi:hypothetical protein